MANKNSTWYYLFFLIALLASIFLSPYLSIAIIIFLIILNKHIIYPMLIAFPLIEVLAVFFDRFTVTRAIGYIYVVIFLIDFFRGNRKILVNRYSFILYAWILVICLGLLNALILKNYYNDLYFSIEEVLWINFSRFVYSVFALLLFFDFAQKSWDEIRNIINQIAVCITIALLIVAIYVYFNPMQKVHYGLIRTGLMAADFNEFASMISAMLIFAIYLLYSGNVFLKVLSSVSIIFSCYIILSTLSRGGIFTLGFTILISLIFIFKLFSFDRKMFIAILFLLLLLPFMYISFVEFDLVERFFSYEQRTPRWEYQIRGIESTVSNNLFLGYGGVPYASRSVNLKTTGQFKVMHSIYVGIFVEYGLVGITIFMFIVWIIVNNFFKQTIARHTDFLLPLLTFLALLFAGLALEWAFRELIWIFLGINLGIINACKRILKKKKMNIVTELRQPI